jgi:AcrR family transcriptional regulator
MANPEPGYSERQLDGDRRRRSSRPGDIVDAAIELMAERGYHSTRMSDIARLVGIQAPSLYNHTSSKQQLLRDIMMETMTRLVSDFESAIESTDDARQQLQRATEANVRYHARYQREAHIANTEIWSLDEPARTELLAMRAQYINGWRELIEKGVQNGEFNTRSPRLTRQIILDMGIGVSRWFDPTGPSSESDIAFFYGEMAARIAGVTSDTPVPVVSEED